MKMLAVALFSGVLGFALIADSADARRFGGGKSFGRSAPAMQPRAPTQNRAAQPQRNANQTAAPARSGASRWLGPLAGLAAGGLLAALFFGGAFEGLQLFDIVIFAALLFGAIWLFKSLRRNAGGSTPAMRRQAYAGAGDAGGYGGAQQPGAQQPGAQQSGAQQPGAQSFETPAIGSGLTGEQPSATAVPYRPDWFNEQEFLTAAKTHFVRLQAAWDVGDMKDIRDYTTPQLFADLTVERQSYKGEQQFTEVVELNAALENLVREDNKLVASVRYDGLIREARDAEAKAFTETWHIERTLDQDNANWHIAGIQQHPAAA